MCAGMSDYTSQGVTSTEEGRAFFQTRLSIFGLCLFVLAGGSWAFLAAVWAVRVSLGAPSDYPPLSSGGILHLSDGLIAGVLWLATRGRPRSGRALHLLDLGISLALVTGWRLVGG